MRESFTLSDWLFVLKRGKKIYHFSELLRLSGLSSPALRRAVQRMRQKKILLLHGVMDQAPYILSCVTTNKTKTFETDLGVIHYMHIKKDLFFGYEIANQVPLASPEKAALDFIYIQRKNGFQPALDEWNWENLDKNKLEDFMTFFPKSVQNHLQKYRED